MKKSDINAIFTEKVSQYINAGYSISANTMSGHQGEDCKIDFVKDDELIRVWMNYEYRDNSQDDSWLSRHRVLVLRVGRWNRPAREANGFCTMWNDHFETIEEKLFYRVGDNNWFVETEEDIILTQEKRFSRLRAKRNNYNMKDIKGQKAKEIASRYMKRKVGYQRVSSDKISISKDVTVSQYIIRYNSVNYFLH